MKKLMCCAAAVIVSAVFIVSCNKPATSLAKYIPKDASFVFELNTKSLLGKLEGANLSLDSLARVLSDDEADSSTQNNITPEDIKQSGVDTAQPAFAFATSSASIMAGKSTSGGLVMGLKNPSAFEALLKKKNPGKEIKKGDNYSFMALGNDFIAGWTDNVAIIASKHGGSSTSTQGTNAAGEATPTQQMLTQMFALKESESIASADGFSDLLKKDADMAFYGKPSGNMQQLSTLGISNLGDLAEGAYSTGTINFEKGKITLAFNMHLSKTMADLLSKYPMKSLDASLLDKFPGKIQGFLVGSMNPQFIPALVKQMGLDGFANSGMQHVGISLTIADIFKALKGDFAVMVSDIGSQTKTITEMGGVKLPQPVTTNTPTFKVLANIAIDKPAYDLVASALAQKGYLTQENGQYQIAGSGQMGVVMNETNTNLYISNSNEVIQQYQTGPANTNNLPDGIRDKVKGKAFAFYIDISALPKHIMPGATDTTEEAPAFKDFIITGDNANGQSTTGNAEVRLVDDSENSLAAFMRFAVKQHEKNKMHKMFPGMQGGN